MKDEELMLAYQSGDYQAFQELYRRYSSRVYGYLFQRLRDRALADDVFQQSFVKLHQSRSRYDAGFPLAPWLFTICRTVMLDALRKNQRHQKLFEALDEEPAAPVAEFPVDSPSLAGLPARQKEALEARYLTGESFEEIAVRLDTSPQNVRQLVSRAVRSLKKLKGVKP